MSIGYDQWLTPERLAREVEAWETSGSNKLYAGMVDANVVQRNLHFVVEFGCGAGLMVKECKSHFWYLGIDNNEHCLELARKNNPKLTFIKQDAKELVLTGKFDLVCAFAFTKHFPLDFQSKLFKRMLACTKHGLFTATVADVSAQDEGCEFVHTRMSLGDIKDAVEAAGHTVIWKQKLPWPDEYAFFTGDLRKGNQ